MVFKCKRVVQRSKRKRMMKFLKKKNKNKVWGVE